MTSRKWAPIAVEKSAPDGLKDNFRAQIGMALKDASAAMTGIVTWVKEAISSQQRERSRVLAPMEMIPGYDLTMEERGTESVACPKMCLRKYIEDNHQDIYENALDLLTNRLSSVSSHIDIVVDGSLEELAKNFEIQARHDYNSTVQYFLLDRNRSESAPRNGGLGWGSIAWTDPFEEGLTPIPELETREEMFDKCPTDSEAGWEYLFDITKFQFLHGDEVKTNDKTAWQNFQLEGAILSTDPFPTDGDPLIPNTQERLEVRWNSLVMQFDLWNRSTDRKCAWYQLSVPNADSNPLPANITEKVDPRWSGVVTFNLPSSSIKNLRFFLMLASARVVDRNTTVTSSSSLTSETQPTPTSSFSQPSVDDLSGAATSPAESLGSKRGVSTGVMVVAFVVSFGVAFGIVLVAFFILRKRRRERRRQRHEMQERLAAASTPATFDPSPSPPPSTAKSGFPASVPTTSEAIRPLPTPPVPSTASGTPQPPPVDTTAEGDVQDFYVAMRQAGFTIQSLFDMHRGPRPGSVDGTLPAYPGESSHQRA
ncbi:hypothetical protein BKA62DRAFT_768562 [Auriculariales sp. MPI-PUGE-AT-0066]|nr:hypothetical protein BKA62DRAFT_768562 [Auriculariales sp. MPI-PUGE-AT-0066]